VQLAQIFGLIFHLKTRGFAKKSQIEEILGCSSMISVTICVFKIVWENCSLHLPACHRLWLTCIWVRYVDDIFCVINKWKMKEVFLFWMWKWRRRILNSPAHHKSILKAWQSRIHIHFTSDFSLFMTYPRHWYTGARLTYTYIPKTNLQIHRPTTARPVIQLHIKWPHSTQCYIEPIYYHYQK
jgi:hypothetical protein